MPAKYLRLADLLKEKIAANLEQGTYKLPTENALCSQYGVSRQTVRRALSILEEEGLIKKTQGSGSVATGLSHNGSQNCIAVLINNDKEYTYPALLHELHRLLGGYGYKVVQYVTENSVYKERQILSSILQEPVKGMIVEGCKSAYPNPNLDLYEKLKAKGTVLLFLGCNYPALPENICVHMDDQGGAYQLGKHLIAKNNTKIAGIFKSDDIRGILRYHGLCLALRDFDLPFSDEQFFWYTENEIKALEQKQDTGFLVPMIHKYLKNCDSIVCQNDEIAYWLIKELHYADIRIPQDIHIVSFDGSYLSDLGNVRITSLVPKTSLALAATETIIKMLHGAAVSSHAIDWQLALKESDFSS